MRQLLFVLALAGVLTGARASGTGQMTTNSVSLGMPGTLEMLTPSGWTLQRTNLNLPNKPVSVELHAPEEASIIRLAIYWDGMNGLAAPTDPKMDMIVSNNATQYAPISVEKKIDLERLKGPAVTGSFARFTDAGWTPVVKSEYPNLATGMFRCANIWGTFDIVTGDKDGPRFNQAIDVVKSFRRTP
jgi:hypothetical protein